MNPAAAHLRVGRVRRRGRTGIAAVGHPERRRDDLQDLALFEDLRALANIELFGALYDLPKATLKARAMAVLEMVGLADRAKDKPAGFDVQAGRSLFGGRDKPAIVLAFDPSQSMVLPMVRGLLSQHGMEVVGQAGFGGSSPVMADLREQAQKNDALPPERCTDLATMFDSIAKVNQPASAA